jgi:exonuclease III
MLTGTFYLGIKKKEIKFLLPSMDNFTRCSDTNDTLDGFKLPKGKGGVSILWPTAWTNNIKMLDGGNERIIAILISASTKLCLINAYMPTSTNSSQTEYRECIDIITDIIEKYQTTHKIILCGDMNGTLLENRSNKHDKILKMFVKESLPSRNSYFSSPRWKLLISDRLHSGTRPIISE